MAEISRRGFLRAARNVLIGGTLGSLGMWQYLDFEATWFNLRQKTVKLPGLAKNLSGLKLVHISDLHFSISITPDVFGEVVDMVNQQSPDVIAITGDYIDSHTNKTTLPEYIPHLARLESRLGTFTVLGNHDYWEDPDLVRSLLVQTEITELANRSVRIEDQGEGLYLCGLDDYREKKQDLDALLADFPEDERGILLMHEPDYADISAATGRFNLQLSGHSHGGQVYFPLIGPPVTPRYGRKYPRGMYHIEDMILYTTTGIGTIPPFVRFNCRPEVAVLTLLPADPKEAGI